jgi:hypothetical protein
MNIESGSTEKTGILVLNEDTKKFVCHTPTAKEKQASILNERLLHQEMRHS